MEILFLLRIFEFLMISQDLRYMVFGALYKSINRKKKKKHEKVVLLAKSKLNSIEFLHSKTLIDWCISRDNFFSVNNLLKEYDRIEEKIEKPN